MAYSFRPHCHRADRPGGRRRTFLPSAESLELRLALSSASAAPPVAMESATTKDSRGVTVHYTLEASVESGSLSFGVYRSADATFDPEEDLPVAAMSLPTGGAAAAPDDDGRPVGEAGSHAVTLPIPDGIPPNPDRPYVLVVAEPTSPGAAEDAGRSASFRVYTVGVVTHGGIQNPSWKNGPPWQLVAARLLQHEEGYDVAIPFNWVAQSSTPGKAMEQAPRLARRVLSAIEQFPEDAVVDLHFIGHSEGAIVNSLAVVRLDELMTPRQKAGRVELTMLDPHAANNSVGGGAQQYSTGGPLGPLTDLAIRLYQDAAGDVAPFVPAGVDEADVFYQRNPADDGGLYNLWGQVPVRGEANYYDLSPTGAKHGGDRGVYWWYVYNVLPSLGDGAPVVSERALEGKVRTDGAVATGATSNGLPRVVLDQGVPVVDGRSAPGSTVTLYVGPRHDPSTLKEAGRTVAADDGSWSIASRRLADGRYRAIATAQLPRGPAAAWRGVRPTTPLGEVFVSSRTGRGGTQA